MPTIISPKDFWAWLKNPRDPLTIITWIALVGIGLLLAVFLVLVILRIISALLSTADDLRTQRIPRWYEKFRHAVYPRKHQTPKGCAVELGIMPPVYFKAPAPAHTQRGLHAVTHDRIDEVKPRRRPETPTKQRVLAPPQRDTKRDYWRVRSPGGGLLGASVRTNYEMDIEAGRSRDESMCASDESMADYRPLPREFV